MEEISQNARPTQPECSANSALPMMEMGSPVVDAGAPEIAKNLAVFNRKRSIFADHRCENSQSSAKVSHDRGVESLDSQSVLRLRIPALSGTILVPRAGLEPA